MTRNIIMTAVVVALYATPLAAKEHLSDSDLGTMQRGEFKAARGIIAQKCTRCHTEKRIDMALSASKDMPKIQQEMEKKGATLNAKEREVLGIYWQQNPLKQKK
jgi:uncharacterized membrane protein